MFPDLDKVAKHLKSWKGTDRRPSSPPHGPITWGEIFDAHAALINHHAQLLHKVQQHTPHGTSSFDTISQMLDRGEEMLQQSKRLAVELDRSEASPLPGPLLGTASKQIPSISISKTKRKASSELSRTTSESKSINLVDSTNVPPQGKTSSLKRKASREEVRPRASETETQKVVKRRASSEGTPGVKKSKHERGSEVERDDITAEVNARLLLKASWRADKEAREGRQSTTETGDASIDKDDISAEVAARLQLKEDSFLAGSPKRKRSRSSLGEGTSAKKVKRHSGGTKKRTADDYFEPDGKRRRV